MRNVHRSYLACGVAAALVCGFALVQRGQSAADDTPGGLAADDGSARVAQASRSEQPAAQKSGAEKPTAEPIATSYPLAANESDERIRQALSKTVKFDFNDKPLRDALGEISKGHGIPVWFDDRALNDLNITTDTPVTRSLGNVSLKSALRLLLRPLQLTFRVDAGVLQITSQTEYDNQLEIRVYPVGDLITTFNKRDALDEADFDSLDDVISSTIGPTSWDDVGGPGSMRPHGQSLIISQTADVHDQIEGLIRMLRKVRADQRKELGGSGVDILSDARSKSIEKALKKPIAWEFDETPLRDAAQFIAKQSGIQVQFDERALTDLNITSDTPVTSQQGSILLKDALRLLLRPLQLTYVVDYEVLSITSQTEADNLLGVRVYPVGDLLNCESDEKVVSVGSCDFDSLIDVISTTVAPTSWDTVGGPGNIGTYEGALALVISQTQEIHEVVDSLLARLRQAQASKGEKKPVTGAPDDKSGLVTRVYALWQFDAQRDRHAEDAQTRPAAKPDSRQLAHLGSIGGFPPPGGGGTLNEQDFDAVPPPGVPSEQVASLVRRLVESESWKQPGVVLQAAPHRLVIRQTAAVQKRTAELLAQLGPWREVQKGPLGGRLGGGSTGAGSNFGGAFQVDDPFAPSAKQNADRDPFEAPANSTAPQDPFGGPAAADPFGAPASQPAPRERPATPDADAAPVAAKRDRSQARPAPYLPSAAESRIREQLATPTEMEFNDLPLRDAITFLKDRHEIELQLDEKWLGEGGIKSDSPVTMQVKGISLRSALRLLLSQLSASATFVVADEVLLITTREGAAHRKLVRIYDVSDFAEPQGPIGRDPFGPPGPQPPAYAAGPITGVQGLVNVIEQAIAPGTWGVKQGSGVVPLLRNDSALLVVHHSAGVQDEIVDLLSSLREMRRRGRRAER